jgi:uncharacterized protein (DUF3820 family)
LGAAAAGCGAPPDSESDSADTPVSVTRSALTAAAPAAVGWTALAHAPGDHLDTCLLLTDGTVMCHVYATNRWDRLTPDASGSYQNGTWSAMPAMPNGNDPNNRFFSCVDCVYAPLFYASAVLKDDRAIVIGGEDNGDPLLDPNAHVWTNIGFIYDPVSDSWSNQLSEVFGGGNMGDTQSVILQDGTFLLASILDNNIESLNFATGVFTAKNPTGKADTRNDEEGWTILSDGTVLTVSSNVASQFQRYTPSTNAWGAAGATPVNLADTGAGSGENQEVGPCVLRPDNKVFCFTGNAAGQNALYTPSSNTWSHTANMDFPASPLGDHFAVPDGPAAALPNGNILVMASTMHPFQFGDANPPSHFYEVSLSTNALTQVADTPNAASFSSYQGRMLVLPTGQVLLTAYNQELPPGPVDEVMLYSNGGAPQSTWRPTITNAPSTLARGGVYTISGTLFNGFTEGATYGDDAQMSTNYPLVRITNQTTHHVFYARTYNHSRMGIEPVGNGSTVTTNFQVPRSFETSGSSTIEVVSNGIASTTRTVTSGACPTNTQTCHPDTGSTFCVPTNWGYEWGQPFPFWSASAETSVGPSADRDHSGSMSLKITASSDPSLPASTNVVPCTDSVVGTMDVRGKTYSAWVFVNNSTSSYAGTSCRLHATDRNFNESTLPASATKSPITPGTWFQLTGVFPSGTLESHIYELRVDCKLPTDWQLNDPTKAWYVDDARVN